MPVLLEKLELYGFKSFAQRTVLRFSPGITAVVGPNGCGKSNISDAIRWAIGESNVRNLRGKQLTDVIFKGTREAKPMGMAEVMLTLDNREQRLSTEYSDVAIQRRAFRSGESDFRINKAPCRLRDIRDLFMDTGLGSAEYAVIEREMIDEVLADRDSARRFLLDEASGITRYKLRRKETLQKLEAVEADLVRVEDALEIEERDVRSLAYQMGKARRYRRLSERIRALDVALARLRWRELTDAASGESGRLSEEARQREEILVRARRAEADQETLRVELLELGRRIGEAQQRLSATETELASVREETAGRKERVRGLQERIADLHERIAERGAALAVAQTAAQRLQPEVEVLATALAERQAVTARAEAAFSAIDRDLRAAREELAQAQQLQLEQVRQRSASDERMQALAERAAALGEQAERFALQRAGLAARADELAGEVARIEEREARTGAELEASQTRRTQTQARREAGETELRATAERLARLGEEEARHESRLRLLEEQSRSFEGYREGVARLLASRSELPGLLGVAAELVTIAPQWRDRLAPALREVTEWVVTDSEASAWKAIDWLRGQGLGQVTFFPLTGRAPVSGDVVAATDAAGVPADAVSARDAAADELARHVRAMIVPVADRAAVPPVAQRAAGRRWVTQAGEVYSAAGWVRAGGGEDAQRRLWQRPEEMAQLRETLAGVRAAREAQRAQAEVIEQARAAIDLELTALAGECQERQSALDNLARARVEREAELRLVGGEAQRLGEEEERLRAQRGEAERERDGSRAAQVVVSAAADSADERLRELAGRVEGLNAEKDDRGRTHTERKLEEMLAETALRDARASLTQHATDAAEIERLTARMTAEQAEAQTEITTASARIEQLGGLETQRLRAKESQSRETDRLAGERQQLEGRLSEIEQDLRARRRALTELEEALRENEVRLARVESEKERLGDRMREQYDLDLAALEQDPATGRAASVGAAGGAPDAGATAPDGATPERDPATPEPDPETVLGELTREAARAQLDEVRLERDRLGPVNVLAIEEHDRKRDHVRFIHEQRNDLLKSKEQLLAAIERINGEARRLFAETFAEVQTNFASTFATLFPGGEAHMQLAGDDPLEADIEIFARPRGKRLESIRLLSSGERALTALALLFGVYLVKPSPFCVLDEVDAPLDDANVERFVNLLRTFSNRTQFIVITHNKLTMETADALYGVTMQEPGISKVVSVRLEGGRLVSDDAAASQALASFTPN
jgi:chromosome segregation protein